MKYIIKPNEHFTVQANNEEIHLDNYNNDIQTLTETVNNLMSGYEDMCNYVKMLNAGSVIIKYDVETTSEAIQIYGDSAGSGFSKVEIDGVVQQNPSPTYRFATIGEHVVKYTLSNPNSIHNNAFEGAWKMKSVIIGDGIQEIGSGAFENCELLKDIIMPDSITYIGVEAFYSCYNLERVNSNINGTFNLPKKLEVMGDYVFADCQNVSNIIFPDTLQEIQTNSFTMANNLTHVYIPSGVTHFADGVFQSCRNLVSIVVDENNTVYDSRNNCNAVIHTETGRLQQGCKATIIPSGVTAIGSHAFHDLWLYNTEERLEFVIPNTVKYIEPSAFWNCYAISAINIPDSVTIIDTYAFHCEDGSHYETITIGNGVTCISNRAFAFNRSLKTITIGTGIEIIESGAFTGSFYLERITIHATTPPELENVDVFTNTNNCPIYVPSASVNAYKTATNWSTYANRIQAIPS